MFVKVAQKRQKENAHSQVIFRMIRVRLKMRGDYVKDSVIILFDKTGKVQFVKEGKLTDDEVKEVISRATALMAK